MEFKVSTEITCKWQSQRFETNKYVSWALFLKLQTAEINFEKLLGWTVFKNPNFNPFQSSSLLPIRGICCICRVILTFLSVLSGYFFYVSLGFDGHFVIPNLAEFRDTASLICSVILRLINVKPRTKVTDGRTLTYNWHCCLTKI